jgi:hypothetical protein
MLRQREIVYRTKLSDLTPEVAEVLGGDPELGTALEQSLLRIRREADADDDVPGPSADFASAIG